MSDADDAYIAAQRLIAEVKASGSAFLNLDAKEFHALSTLPPEIADLTEIIELYLDNTQVTNLTPLTDLKGLEELYLDSARVTDVPPLVGLTGLTKLWLDNSQVADLRPLLSLFKQAGEPEYPEYNGLAFHNTPATELDPKLAELSEIKDAAERATKTFAYLREVGDDWPPIPTTSPDQDTILTVSQTEDGRLDISPPLLMPRNSPIPSNAKPTNCCNRPQNRSSK